MWGSDQKKLKLGRKGAVARVAEMERRARFWKITLLITYCLGAFLFFVFFRTGFTITAYVDRWIVNLRPDPTYNHPPPDKTKYSHTASMDEEPFIGLNPRHSGKVGEKSTSDWFVWGVSRYQAPTFYLGVWATESRRKITYDIRKRLENYGTLVSWGEVRLVDMPEDYSTAIGSFEIQHFTYHPPAGAQNCVFFSSVNIAPGGYVRGHYCVAASAKLDYELLDCAISSVRHPDLKLVIREDEGGCNGRKIQKIALPYSN